MKIRQFLEIAKIYGINPIIKRVVEKKGGIFIGSFVVKYNAPFCSIQENMQAFKNISQHFTSTLVQINFAHLAAHAKTSKENVCWDASITFISNGFKKIASGTSYIDNDGRVWTYEMGEEFCLPETNLQQGLLAITLFPAGEKIAVGIIPNSDEAREVIENYQLDTPEIKKANPPFFFMTTHQVSDDDQEDPHLKDFIIL